MTDTALPSPLVPAEVDLREPLFPEWQEYECRKRAWLADHRGATPEEAADALQRIAYELGL